MGASLQTGGGGSRRGRHVRKRPMAEINVTPMVDVMLVLLIIFMVAAPMMQQGLNVDLPQQRRARPVTTPGVGFIEQTEQKGTGHAVMVGREALAGLDGYLMILYGDSPLLRAVSEERKSDKVFLRADGAIPYEGVMQVMGALNASGFRNIGLVTEQGGPRFDEQDG